MVLVDTSVWIDHLRSGNPRFASLLEEGKVLCHPFVIGELACGHIHNRKQILDSLQEIPVAVLADHDEVMALIESYHLMGTGLGLLDAYLLASACLSGSSLWTRDSSLQTAAAKLGVLYT